VDIVGKLQPATLIDGRLGIKGDYVSTGDNVIPSLARDDDWETPATVNHTWGFRRDDEDWKSPGEILFKLMDIVSKGGNYLLNVGPDADGVIPTACADNLRAVGRWLKVYGEAVYGAGRSPFGEEFGEFSVTQKDRMASRYFLNGRIGGARRGQGRSTSPYSMSRGKGSICRPSRIRYERHTCWVIRKRMRL
jgi:alpha-L-fucosidase